MAETGEYARLGEKAVFNFGRVFMARAQTFDGDAPTHLPLFAGQYDAVRAPADGRTDFVIRQDGTDFV